LYNGIFLFSLSIMSDNVSQMNTNDLNYELPAELIAQCPAQKRSASRLLRLDRRDGRLSDGQFSDLGSYLRAGDCLVLNNTKVLPARFYGQRQTGAKLEGLFLCAQAENLWQVLLKGARKLKPEESFYILSKDRSQNFVARIVEQQHEGKYLIQLDIEDSHESTLETIGFPPLPPYIKRDNDLKTAETDKQRYQTVFAQHAGAVAAPTAGLHFSQDLLSQVQRAGIKVVELTLHVGMGTFKPVTAEKLQDHPIHAEEVIIDQACADIINQTRRNKGRVIAVGTTSVRSLESAATGQGRATQVQAFKGETRLFITPGYEFKIVDALITNFHLPKSTLIALVGAFAGLDRVMQAYEHAIAQQYRFYSYGDAMLII
jgi:S-adenosylmethionine:tRNA ribosyltransferase-isomerase